MSEILSKELSKYNITVNVIGPTPIYTDLIKVVPKEKVEEIINKQTIKRFGEFSDISNVINFFISDEVNLYWSKNLSWWIMILDIIKKYHGISIIDKNGNYTFEDLIRQVDIFSNLLDEKIKKFDSVMIYSDYNFFSITLLIYLSSRILILFQLLKLLTMNIYLN